MSFGPIECVSDVSEVGNLYLDNNILNKKLQKKNHIYSTKKFHTRKHNFLIKILYNIE